MTALVIIVALLLDKLLGELSRWHPLVGFGRIADIVETYLNTASFRGLQFLGGMLAWLLLSLLPALVWVIAVAYVEGLYTDDSGLLGLLLESIVVYFAIASRSLDEHARAILRPLQLDNVPAARSQLARIVSRDTAQLDKAAICKATIESVLENGSDAIFAPIFWYVIGGLPAVIVYRLSNTLDAMWGYKTQRFLFFGRFTARMDDILNWLPARLVAISYALLGNTSAALTCWRQQAASLASPNAGVVMTAGAGALLLELGGRASYHGKAVDKPLFGCGQQPQNQDIARSLALVKKTLYLWCAIIVLTSLFYLDGFTVV
ncbi:MAG: adenosylcobinamide-phosphate synthase CbiB [Cellvibrionaceae bacterium]|nr:adenosylcobinamide-phosphate synthase CbiB [Cellvibrionaceae bacterium]